MLAFVAIGARANGRGASQARLKFVTPAALTLKKATVMSSEAPRLRPRVTCPGLAPGVAYPVLYRTNLHFWITIMSLLLSLALPINARSEFGDVRPPLSSSAAVAMH